MSFKLGETYLNGAGSSVLIIATDAKARYGAADCPVIGLVTPKGHTYANAVLMYSAEGRYCGFTPKEYNIHALISNEPNEEEAELIREIGNLCERIGDDREERLLKVIRQLRKK